MRCLSKERSFAIKQRARKIQSIFDVWRARSGTEHGSHFVTDRTKASHHQAQHDRGKRLLLIRFRARVVLVYHLLLLLHRFEHSEPHNL